MKILYRIEHIEKKRGAWYTFEGIYDPLEYLINSCHEPMEWDCKFSFNNKNWFSAVNSLDEMALWFYDYEVDELIDNGYRLYEFLVSSYRVDDDHAYFTRNSIISRNEISFDLLLLL